jgi:hypothetical protein
MYSGPDEFVTLVPGMDVYDREGDKVGSIDAVLDDDTILVQKGFFFPTDYAIPVAAIEGVDDEDRVYLRVTKDAALSQKWEGDYVSDTGYGEAALAGAGAGGLLVPNPTVRTGAPGTGEEVEVNRLDPDTNVQYDEELGESGEPISRLDSRDGLVGGDTTPQDFNAWGQQAHGDLASERAAAEGRATHGFEDAGSAGRPADQDAMTGAPGRSLAGPRQVVRIRRDARGVPADWVDDDTSTSGTRDERNRRRAGD